MEPSESNKQAWYWYGKAQWSEKRIAELEAELAKYQGQEKELARQFHRAEKAEAEVERLRKQLAESCEVCGGEGLHEGRTFCPRCGARKEREDG